jgi:hypothetical protein
MLLMQANRYLGRWEGVGPWKLRLFWAPNGIRLKARCHFKGPKKSGFLGPSPSHWPSWWICPHQKYYIQGHISHRSIKSYTGPTCPVRSPANCETEFQIWGGGGGDCLCLYEIFFGPLRRSTLDRYLYISVAGARSSWAEFKKKHRVWEPLLEFIKTSPYLIVDSEVQLSSRRTTKPMNVSPIIQKWNNQ